MTKKSLGLFFAIAMCLSVNLFSVRRKKSWASEKNLKKIAFLTGFVTIPGVVGATVLASGVLDDVATSQIRRLGVSTCAVALSTVLTNQGFKFASRLAKNRSKKLSELFESMRLPLVGGVLAGNIVAQIAQM